MDAWGKKVDAFVWLIAFVWVTNDNSTTQFPQGFTYLLNAASKRLMQRRLSVVCGNNVGALARAFLVHAISHFDVFCEPFRVQVLVAQARTCLHIGPHPRRGRQRNASTNGFPGLGMLGKRRFAHSLKNFEGFAVSSLRFYNFVNVDWHLKSRTRVSFVGNVLRQATIILRRTGKRKSGSGVLDSQPGA